MEKINLEKAAEILRQQGMNVNLEQVRLIVELLQKVAAIFVSEYLQESIENVG